jgi:hypothetical protein
VPPFRYVRNLVIMVRVTYSQFTKTQLKSECNCRGERKDPEYVGPFLFSASESIPY